MTIINSRPLANKKYRLVLKDDDRVIITTASLDVEPKVGYECSLEGDVLKINPEVRDNKYEFNMTHSGDFSVGDLVKGKKLWNNKVVLTKGNSVICDEFCKSRNFNYTPKFKLG